MDLEGMIMRLQLPPLFRVGRQSPVKLAAIIEHHDEENRQTWIIVVATCMVKNFGYVNKDFYLPLNVNLESNDFLKWNCVTKLTFGSIFPTRSNSTADPSLDVVHFRSDSKENVVVNRPPALPFLQLLSTQLCWICAQPWEGSERTARAANKDAYLKE
uniref:Uncharacterized protein n=1 Tax=Pristionchus pacificus TaxID=54126 RepID=A0A2A6BM42_PRIPA|eukprot:PDM66967.1 hypothetical protein PRIPAC_48384 [Pristionchus pacificus]